MTILLYGATEEIIESFDHRNTSMTVVSRIKTMLAKLFVHNALAQQLLSHFKLLICNSLDRDTSQHTKMHVRRITALRIALAMTRSGRLISPEETRQMKRVIVPLSG